MSGVKVGSKYARLLAHLRLRQESQLTLTLAEIETILNEPLPASAGRSPGFWSNRRKGLQSSAWLEAGYHVHEVDLEAQAITFVRRSQAYTLRIEEGRICWDGPLILALRTHLGLNQAQLAEALGVRQQTVSEWESGRYEPSRGRSKHLSRIAESGGFPAWSEKEGG